MSVIAPKIKPELAAELVKLARQGGDLWGPEGLFQQLKKAMVDQMLEAEMDDHLGFGRGDRSDEGRRPNSRNGHTEKAVKTETGTMTVRVPRDRDGSFTPRLIPKNARRLEGFDQKLLSLYARGMTTREIQGHLEELYGTEVSPQLVSEVTESVLEQAKAWQGRPLESVYTIVYLDALFGAIRDGGVDLKNRGVQDIFFACCDGLKGFPEAITTAFPLAIVQTCVVHIIRASLRFVSYVDRKALARDLRPIYSAATEADAATALDTFEEKWGKKYPAIAKLWRTRWNEIVPFLAFPGPIRRILYTTNAIESLNFQFRKALNPRGHFPSDDAAFKLLYLALLNHKAKGKAPKEWGNALAHFQVMFADRFPVG